MAAREKTPLLKKRCRGAALFIILNTPLKEPVTFKPEEDIINSCNLQDVTKLVTRPDRIPYSIRDLSHNSHSLITTTIHI